MFGLLTKLLFCIGRDVVFFLCSKDEFVLKSSQHFSVVFFREIVEYRYFSEPK